MKITRSQLKHIIKEEIKHIVYEQGIRQPGEPWVTSIGHEIRMDRDEPRETAVDAPGPGFEEMRRQAGLSSPKTPVRTDPEEIEPEDEGVHLAVWGTDTANPSGGYVSAGGGIPNWEVDRAGEIHFRESRQRKLQRIIEEEFVNILKEQFEDPVDAAMTHIQQGGDDVIRYGTVRTSPGGGYETSAQPPRPVDVDPPEITYVPGYDPETGTFEAPSREWTGTSFGTSAGEELFIGPQAEQYTGEDLGQSALEQVVQEIMGAVLNEQSPRTPAGYSHADYPMSMVDMDEPVATATPIEMDPEVIDLSDAGYGQPPAQGPGSSARRGARIPELDALIASLPEVDPEEDPELVQRYPGGIPVGERGVTMLRQQRPEDYYFGN